MTSAVPYNQPMPSYAKILSQSGAQSSQKWCQLNFDDGFEFNDLDNAPNCRFVQTEQIT